MKWVLHDWEDDKCVQILNACRAAMASDSRVLLVERLMPPEGVPPDDTVFGDVTMIVHTGGRERTQAQYSALLEAAGLRLDRLVPTRLAEAVIIEAILAPP
jgi:hypothetical protein